MTQRLILISGGIGTGKSAVRLLLGLRGVRGIDADAIGHSVLEPTGGAFGDVSSRWPTVLKDGLIDRRALGRIVFNNRDELAHLESITHPLIRRQITRQVDAFPDISVAVEYPLLDGSFGEEWIRLIVDAPDEMRVARLLERGMSENEIRERIAAQPSRDEWLRVADIVVDNSGDRVALESELDRVVQHIVHHG